MTSAIDTLVETSFAEEQTAAHTWRRMLKSVISGDTPQNRNPNELNLPVLLTRKEDKQPCREGCPPWQRKDYSYDILGLHEEVNDFYEYVKPKSCEIRMRYEVISSLRSIISSKWPLAKVHVFGSVHTRLFLPTSDVDIVVLGQWNSLPPLFTLKEEIEAADIAEPNSILVLDKAKVPIVKLIHKKTKLKVDISFNTMSGLSSARTTEEFTEMYPILPKLLFVIKHFLNERNLNEVYTGGIGSYTLILLIASFLQMHPRKDAAKEDANLGVLLIEFFELYGRMFNYNKTGIMVHDGGRYFPKDQWIHPQNVSDGILCVVDPTNTMENTARGSYNFMQVKLAFEHAFLVLNKAVLNQEKDFKSKKTILNLIVSVSDKMIRHREWVSDKWSNEPLSPPPTLPSPGIVIPYQSYYPTPPLVHHQWVPVQQAPVVLSYQSDSVPPHGLSSSGFHSSESNSNNDSTE
jgi:non-canonical poly(A) RNA polymerase PAPD5/7